MALLSRIGLIGVFVTLLSTMSQAQQGQPLLQISSPADGAIVSPGQSVNITVTSPAGANLSNIGLIGNAPLGLSDVTASLPAQISIVIPSDISCRRYALTAFGVTDSGDLAQSAPINLDVERPDMPISLSSQFQSLTMEAVGQATPMTLLATFSDGSVFDVTESSNIAYQSTNTSIAMVDSNGTTTGVAAGTASILVTYRNANGPNLQLSVLATVLPPLLTIAPSSPDFGSVNFGFSTSLSLTLTNRAASDNNLNVKAIAVSGNYAETDNCVSSSPLPVGGTCGITVTFAPTAAGQNPGTLTIVNSSSMVPSVIPLTGIGVVAPIINGIAPNLGASGTGTQVTINGSNFGTSQGDSIVTFGAVNAIPATWSDSRIVITVPTGLSAGTTSVSVTVNGRSSAPAPFSVIPVITALSASSAILGTPITITGTSFGNTQGTSTVTFNGVDAAPTSWSATSITVPVPALATSGVVVVSVNGIATNGVNITVLRPNISSLSPSVGPSGTGMQVTIAGSNFGTGQGTSTVTFGGASATPISWSDSSIVAPVPVGLSVGNKSIIVTVGGGDSGAASFTIIPAITSLSANSGAAGTPIVVNGTSFGSSQGTSTITFNGIAASPTSWNVSSITAPVPTGATSGPVVVTVNGLASNGASFTVSTAAPSISSISPTSGPIGSSVTIAGSNFGASQNGTVFFTQANHALVPAVVTSWSDTSITVTVPGTAATGNVKLLINGLFSNAKTFTVTP